MDEKSKLILAERKFREELVELVNNYNEIPAFTRKTAVKELYEQLILLEQSEYAKAEQLKQEEKKGKQDEKGDSEQGT